MRARLIVPFLLLSVLLTGCMASKNSAAVDRASDEWRMKTLEASFLDFREKQRSSEDADIMARKKLAEEIKVLQDKVAMLESTKSDPASTSMTKKPKMPPGEGWVTDLKPGVDGWTSVKAGSKKKPTAKKNTKKPAKKVVMRTRPKRKAKPKKAKRAVTGQSLYDKGLMLYRTSKFDEARKTFDAYIAKYPKGKLAPNSLYWKGEAYYTQKQYAQAILTFKEVSRRYPKSPKASAALLKTGMAYEMAGDADNAVFYLRALVEDFPKSSAAKIAKQRLANLGG